MPRLHHRLGKEGVRENHGRVSASLTLHIGLRRITRANSECVFEKPLCLHKESSLQIPQGDFAQPFKKLIQVCNSCFRRFQLIEDEASTITKWNALMFGKYTSFWLWARGQKTRCPACIIV